MKIGRNDLCPCGSGKKYKSCHGARLAAEPARRAAPTQPAPQPRAARAAAIATAANLNQLGALLRERRFAEAERAARLMIAQQPEQGRIWRMLGAALAMQGKDALPELQRACQLMPNDPESFFYFGNALYDRGQVKAAAECLRRAVALKPDFAEAFDNLGMALRDLGLYSEAIAQHQRAIAIRPAMAEAHNHLGMALRAAGNTQAALACYQRALELQPTFIAAQGNLANALRDSGRTEQAIAAYRQVLAMSPNLAPAHYNFAKALQQAGSIEEAKAGYRRAIELHPGFLEARVELADLQRETGQVSEAIEAYGQLLAQRPDLAEVHNRMGNALLVQGQAEQAVASYRRALELQPNYAEAYANLSNALRDQGRLREALVAGERAVELKPDLPEAHHNLGVAQLDLLLLNDAEASLRRAIALRPGYASAHVALSMSLRKFGRGAEAEASARQALELQPENAETLAFMAEFPADRGEFTQAEQLFRRALAINPRLPEAWAGIPRFRKMGSKDDEWRQAAEPLAASGLPIRHEINLRFALGKYFDDVQDYAQAFENFQRANELNKHYGLRQDRAQLARHIDEKMAHFNAAWLEQQRGAGNDTRRPVLIVGMPRSGTTLIEQIVAAHPEGFGAGELPFWNGAGAAYEAAGFGTSVAEGFIARAAGDYEQLLRSLSAGAVRVADKMPSNFMHLGLINAALPTARIIHIRRHPIDTCLSIYFQNFSTALSYGNDLDELADYYSEYLRLMAHWRALLPSDALLEIQYEALIEDPESWSRKLIEFAGLAWDPRCLDFHAAGRSVMTASKWQVRQKINKASAGRWRHYEAHVGPLQRLVSDLA